MSSLDKAIERKFPAYFIFGVRADGRVDIASTHDDTVATMSRDDAEKVIKERDEVLAALSTLAHALNDRVTSSGQAIDGVFYNEQH